MNKFDDENCKHLNFDSFRRMDGTGCVLVMKVCAHCGRFLGTEKASGQIKGTRQKEETAENVIERITSPCQPGVG